MQPFSFKTIPNRYQQIQTIIDSPPHTLQISHTCSKPQEITETFWTFKRLALEAIFQALQMKKKMLKQTNALEVFFSRSLKSSVSR